MAYLFCSLVVPQKRSVDIESVGSKRSKRASGVQTRSTAGTEKNNRITTQ